MFKMLKVHKDTHTVIKTRASENSMSIMEYMNYIVNEEKSNSIKFMQNYKNTIKVEKETQC